MTFWKSQDYETVKGGQKFRGREGGMKRQSIGHFGDNSEITAVYIIMVDTCTSVKTHWMYKKNERCLMHLFGKE